MQKDDVIYRQMAIDAVISLCDDCDSDYCGSCRVNYPGEKDARKALKDLPSAQPEQRWIPCSERLPEDGTEVFIYLFDRPSPYIAWIGDTHWYTEDFEVDREDEPIAWMPLPTPYRKGATT